MAWDFTTEPEFQEKLDWANAFVRNEIEPLDVLFGHLTYQRITEPLKTVVDQLKDLAMRAKCAVVLSTHDERIFDVATRRLHIEDGRCFEVPIHYH